MALREKVFTGPHEDDLQVLKKKAEKFELKELERIIPNRGKLLVLEKLLNEAYLIRRPKPSEYEHRKQLIRVFNEIARELYGNSSCCPVVEEFGSFSMDLFTTGSDLDLSVNFKNNSQSVFPRDQKIKALRKFARKFYALQTGGHVRGVQPVLSAKVPILKVIDAGSGVECDLSVENRDGISKSAIIRLITSIDERFKKLSFLMKAWAKAHDINSSKDRTLNSLSIILLVAFHLQNRDPPILPPFSEILKDGEDVASVQKSVRKFRNYGSKNTETLGELLVSFLLKVEDFTDRTQNVARAVGKSEVEKIYSRIHFSIQRLSLFMNGEIQESVLNESLFGITNTLHHHPPLTTTTTPMQPRAAQSWLPRPQPVGGQWGGMGTQHQAMGSGQEWADDHPPKRMRVAADGAPGTQGWGTWGPELGGHNQPAKRMRAAEGAPTPPPPPPPGTQGWGNWGPPGWGAEDYRGRRVQQPHGPTYRLG
ncbi:protein HESO1 isoform X3 [Lactuca sativa]|uniref:protein HESO1 isoform X3 n=1 Tax=Lactuca sativa TaxID=4236 RepID=UPI000CD96A95|nr:protein HESO1 isoform X3 [Lactuca sativa]